MENQKNAKRKRLKRYFAKTKQFDELEDLLVISTSSLTFKEKLIDYGRKRSFMPAVKSQRLHLSQLFVMCFIYFITF